MFTTVLELLVDLLGYYIIVDKRQVAIGQTFAIDQDVFGLEVIVGAQQVSLDRLGWKTVNDVYTTEIFLTQHEGGRNTIDTAKHRILETLGQKVTVKTILSGGSQKNVKRYLVTVVSNCACS